MKKQRTRINEQIRARELRVIGADGKNIGVIDREEALKQAEAQGMDLIEISPEARPPVAKIADYGKHQYEMAKKEKAARANAKVSELKNVQIKVGTGEHDLSLKAKKAAEFLREGHRVKIELFLRGRVKYLDQEFLKKRLDRVLNLIPEEFRVAEDIKKGPKGLVMIIERAKKKSE